MYDDYFVCISSVFEKKIAACTKNTTTLWVITLAIALL